MANLTISVDDAVLRRARIRALENGESVNRILARSLEQYANAGVDSPLADFIALADEFVVETGIGHVGDGRGWTRDELHRV